MTVRTEFDSDFLRELELERMDHGEDPKPIPAHVCRCGNPDWPGRCPGWKACPIWQEGEDA